MIIGRIILGLFSIGIFLVSLYAVTSGHQYISMGVFHYLFWGAMVISSILTFYWNFTGELFE